MANRTFHVTKKIMLKKLCLGLIICSAAIVCFLMLLSYIKTENYFLLVQKNFTSLTQQSKLLALALIADILMHWNHWQLVFDDGGPASKNKYYFKYGGIGLGGKYPLYYHLIKNVTVNAKKSGSVIKIYHENILFDNHMQTTILHPEYYGASAEEMLQYFPKYIPITYQ